MRTVNIFNTIKNIGPLRPIFLFFLSLLSLSYCALAVAGGVSRANKSWTQIWESHPIYLGFQGGTGSTDWSQLVLHAHNQVEYDDLSLSTPIEAGDRGFVYGFFAGYEISLHFALEMNYLRFPDTLVSFDQYSLYAFDDNITSMESKTYVYNIVGRFMVPIAHTGIRGFASAGGALIHRHDNLTNTGHIGPTFGIGMNYVFLEHYMAEFAFQYYAGYGKAVMKPAINYVPFLYSIMGRFAYRF